MELALITGLGLIGTYISNNKKEDESDPIIERVDYINKHLNRRLTDANITKRIIDIENNENDESINYDNGYKNESKVRLFPNEYNGKVHHLYDTQIIKSLDKKYYDTAKDQREKSKIPQRTNIIPPLFNQDYIYNNSNYKQHIMGPVPTHELSGNNIESFESQFNLQTTDNRGEPAAKGDIWKSSNNSITTNLENNLLLSQGFSPFDSVTSDMTYGIVEPDKLTHNNMQKFSSRRDVAQTESNNFEYKMEIFAGSSKNWNPKRETVPFFDPEEFKETPFGTEIVTDAQRDRVYQSRVKQNERPFEPIDVAPGLNLDFNDMPKHGRHDTFRTVPKDINDLRTANKPKVEYKGRAQGAPKKGEKRGVTAPVIKRRPEQWRYQTVDDLVPNRAVNTAQQAIGTFIIPDNARMINTYELKGHVQAPTLVGPDNRAGGVSVSKRVTHVEDKLGPKATDQFNPNEKSYNILLNERNTTNYDDMQGPRNPNNGGKTYDPKDIAKATHKQTIEKFEPVGPNTTTRPKTFDPNDKAKATQKETLTTKEFNTVFRQLAGAYSNLTDQAKMTIRHIISTQTYEQIIQSAQHNVYTNLSDNAKKTLKEILTLCELNTNTSSSQKEVYSNFQDKANNTLRQVLSTLENNTVMGSAQKETYTNLSDVAKTTQRQVLTEAEFNTNVTQLISSYSNLTDSAKNTIKQILTESEFNTQLGPAQKNLYSSLSDNAKNTLKQMLTLTEFNTQFGSAQKNLYSSLSDTAKNTLKQIFTGTEFNTQFGSAQKNLYSSLSDNAKNTLKQVLTNAEFNNNMGSKQKDVYSNLQDIAKHTTRETLTDAELNTFISNTARTYANLNDEARNTIKQILATQPLDTIISTTKRSYANLQDNAKSTIKQLLTLETFSNFIKQNIGSYSNITDEAKHTIKELLSTLELNNNLGSAQKQSYTELMDIAKHTIKEYIALQEYNNNISSAQKNPNNYFTDLAKNTHKQETDVKSYNNNVGTIKKEIAFNPNDLARTTHKQDLLNENYIGTMANSSVGVQQVDFFIAPTQKDMNKAYDYKSAAFAAGFNKDPQSQMDARNMRQNVVKEVVAQGRSPTLSGPKLIPTVDEYQSMEQKVKPNYSVANGPKLTTKINLEDRNMFRTEQLKNGPYYDDRLYHELLSQFEDNPLVNNIQTVTGAEFIN